MEIEPPYQIPTLKQLCTERIANTIGTFNPSFCFDGVFAVGKAQQENAALLEQQTPYDIKVSLKEVVLAKYAAYTDGCPWQEIGPSFVPSTELLTTPSFCYDFSPRQKLVALFAGATRRTPLLRLFTLDQTAQRLIPTHTLDVSAYKNLHNISFSPQGRFLLLAYNDPKGQLDHALVKVVKDHEDTTLFKQCLLPSEHLVHTCSVYFTPNDSYVLIRSLHKVLIADLHRIGCTDTNQLEMCGKIKKCYTAIELSPTSYHIAAREFGGNIDVYALNDGKPNLIAHFWSLCGNNNFHWMPCGTKLFIQESNTNLLWNPHTETKQNLTTRFPLIHERVVAYSRSQKYCAYACYNGVVILDSQLHKYWFIKGIYACRMTFDDTDNVSILHADGSTYTYAPYEYTAMPLNQLLAICWLSQSVLHADKRTNQFRIQQAAMCVTETEGFQSLPLKIQKLFLERIKEKL